MEIKETGPQGGNTGKPEQPIVPHHDQDYRQSEFDQTQADLKTMRAARASTPTTQADVIRGILQRNQPPSPEDAIKTAPAKQKNPIQKFFGNTAARIGLATLGVATLGGTALWANDAGPFHRESPTSSAPNLNAPKGTIKAESMAEMSAKEYASVGPQIVENGQINIPLAVRFKDGKIRALDYQISRGSLGAPLLTIAGLEEGDTLLALADGEIEIHQGSEGLTGFFLNTKDAKGDEVSIMYATTGLSPSPLINPKKAIEDGKPIPVKIGDPIGTLLSSQKHRAFNGQLQIGGIALGIPPQAIAVTPDGKPILIQ